MHKMKCMKSLPIFVCKIQENTKKKRHKLSHTIKKYVLIQMKRFLCEWKKKNYFGSIPLVFLRSGVGEEIVES